MQLIIHCGLDKAGSTAIQAHVALFRQWLMRNGVYVPESGLSGFGHVALFRELGGENWQPLLEELRALDQTRYRHCFLSYEGIRAFDAAQLALVRDHLRDYEVTVLFYLREQAEILQSGYLQRLKSEAQPLSIAHLNADHSLLVPDSRDYFRLLRKFESVFGREGLALRLYQPDTWRDGSIVWDLLEFLGCAPDDQIAPSVQRQNISLDVQSARILNVYDSYAGDSAHRAALVEDLLWLAQRHPGGSKYFLAADAVQAIRDHYRVSNAALAQRYGIGFACRDCAAHPPGGRVSYLDELARLARYPRWKGERLEGPGLAALLQHQPGWSRVESWGAWSLGDASHVEFRLPLSRFTGFEDALVLRFRGRYFADNTSTRVLANDILIGEFDLREGVVNIPFRLLDDDRVVHLQLLHQAPVSPAALGMNDDGRRLAYGLQGIGFDFAR